MVCSTKQRVCCPVPVPASPSSSRTGVPVRKGPVRGEDVDDGVDVVAGHPGGIAGEQLLDLGGVGDLGLVHRPGAPLSSRA
jgi:hypothetical protein